MSIQRIVHAGCVLLVGLILAASLVSGGSDGPLSQECTASTKQQEKLEKLIREGLRDTFTSRTYKDESFLRNFSQSLGPGRVDCYDENEVRFISIEFGIKPNQAVGMRSLSKVMVASALLALSERGVIDLDRRVGDFICPEASFANSTPAELLAMASKAMDGRLNALRAAQLFRRAEVADFVGFPPVCDEFEYNPAECVERVVCPIYMGEPSTFRRVFGIHAEEFEGAEDLTCGPTEPAARRACMDLATKRNACVTKAAYMREKCFFACPYSPCEKTVDRVGAHLIDENTRWEYKFDSTTNEIYKVESAFVYDNYGYTILDAIIYQKTNKFLYQWVKELIMEPLGMKGSTRCLKDLGEEPLEPGEEAYECLTPPKTVTEWHNSEFPPWRRGQMTRSWVSNAFFASSDDLIKFISMLLRNGTQRDAAPDGPRVLSQASVDSIFTPRIVAKRPLWSFIGKQAFGLGMGYCDRKEVYHPYPHKYMSEVSRTHPQALGLSICSAERTWGWGSSHGSRVAILRDKNVACMAVLNAPNIGEPPTRAHFIGHNISAMMRDVFGL